MVPILPVNYLQSEWTAIALLSLAAAAHQGWSANLFTTTSDMFPRSAVGSVTGIGGMAGSVGGFLLATFAGYILQMTHSYASLFVDCGERLPRGFGGHHTAGAGIEKSGADSMIRLCITEGADTVSFLLQVNDPIV